MNTAESYFPNRIVCLTEEARETLYLLGEEHRVVGISGFAAHADPDKKKPRVSGFSSANVDKIVALQPDLVIGYSDVQAKIAKELIARGVTVWVNNHRSVEGIFQMIVQIGSLVGKAKIALGLVKSLRKGMEKTCAFNRQQPHKPTIYFEEWPDPLISGIQWVSELITFAGGKDIFEELSSSSLAKNRVIPNSDEVVTRNPDIIIASWCGKKVNKNQIIQRPGWENITAVKNDYIYEIPSDILLNPGPAALSKGLVQIAELIQQWHHQKINQ